MNKRYLGLACVMLIAAGGLGAGARADITMTFDDPVVIGPGGWSVDRHASTSFASTTFMADHRLLQVIDGNDAQAANFYNTQGFSYNLESGTQSMSIELYVPQNWETAAGDRRFAGFWGVSPQSSGVLLSYPIIEFAKVGSDIGFRFWDTSTDADWMPGLFLPAGFTYGTFHKLQIDLVGANYVYKVDDQVLASIDSHGATSIDSVILQGYNGPTYGVLPGQSYTIYWDNFHSTTGAVPEPASVVSAVLGAVGAGLFALRRGRKAAA
jgi:hypothetical protein